ncbi:MAG TPA: phosphoglycolate phosphatase [Burkholderiales bacterium]|nr:phosphoglycolate phosphatase [Burkholderiales bacterium]
MVRAVLFDLDGTLADTAPDLNAALNRVRAARGLAPLPLSATRCHASRGARGLLGAGFGLAPGDPGYDALREEFLAAYGADLCRETRLFPGVPELLGALEASGLRWGVVTNKQEHLAHTLLERLGLRNRAACVIGGDTTAWFKPHPGPLLAACGALGMEAGACIYVGDDRRDVEAARAAGMRIAVAEWGYLGGEEPESWEADWLIKSPQELLGIL